MDVLEKIGFILLGAVISGAGYLIKRKIESAPQSDALDRQKKLLEINKQMREQSLSVEDIKSLEAALTGKAEAIAKHVVNIERETKPLTEKRDGEFLSQAEMNLRADANLKISRAKMEQILTELSFKLDGFERDAMYESQKIWEAYSLKQAEAESASYMGGSIYPLRYLSELESLTVERAARLQSRLDELRRLRS